MLKTEPKLRRVGDIELRESDPLKAWRWLDQFLSVSTRLVPGSDELAVRFGGDIPIFADEEVLDEAGVLFEADDEEQEVAQFRPVCCLRDGALCQSQEWRRSPLH